MTQYDFDKLMEKYLLGDCSPDEELLLDEWSSRQIDNVEIALTEDEAKSLKKQMWKRIQNTTFVRLTPLSIRWWSRLRLGIAASLVLAVSASGFMYFSSFSFQNRDKNAQIAGTMKGVEMTNTTATAQNITLNDGSTVRLQPNSSITFPEKFGDKNRLVYLRGEGFFMVKRDTTKPFLVHAGNLVTEVLGTSFTVKSYEKDKTAEVVVVSGKVAVYKTAYTEGGAKQVLSRLILTPNQKIVFEKTTESLTPQVVQQPIPVNPPTSEDLFIFQDSPLKDVLQVLKQVYALEIEASPDLQNCAFTGNLNGFDLFEQLEWICKSMNAKYEKQATKIVLIGKGCQ